MLASIRILTYNIHSFRGTDGKMDAQRVANILSELNADVIALQEVQQSSAALRSNQLATLAETLDMEVHFTKTRPQGDEDFGIATLVRHPFHVRAEGTLPSLRKEPRAAQWLSIRAGSTAVDLVNTHLSVNFFERVHQLRSLVQHPEADPRPAGVFPRLPASDHLVLVGDFNAGYLSPEYRYLSRRLRNAQRCVRRWLKPTYPSRFPLLRLDHVWIGQGWDVENATVVSSPATRLASDHLPLLVTLRPRIAAHTSNSFITEAERADIDSPSPSTHAANDRGPHEPHHTSRA